jgi:hypothetical protein
MIADMSEDGLDPPGNFMEAVENGHGMANDHTMMNGNPMIDGHDMANGHGMMNGHPMVNGHNMMNNHGMINDHGMLFEEPRLFEQVRLYDLGWPDDRHLINYQDMANEDQIQTALVSAPVFAPVSAPVSAPAPTPTPALPSLNPEAPAFLLHGGEIPTVNAARTNAEHYPGEAVNIARNVNQPIAAAGPDFENSALIWPPFSQNDMSDNDRQAFIQIRTQLAAQFIVSPVRVSDLPTGAILRGNPVLPFRPRQPIPVVFVDAELRHPEFITPLGLYWALLTEIFRVTNEGQSQPPDHVQYCTNLNTLVWLVHDPRDSYEAFILLHALEWVKYHRRLFDDLIASVDRRRATMEGPDRLLTNERVNYVNLRAHVMEAIGRLEQALENAHHSQGCPFWRTLISLALGGRVVVDPEHSPARYDPSDAPSEDGRHEGPEDVFSGDDEAPEDEDFSESASSRDNSAPGDDPAGAFGQADSEVDRTESGPVVNSGTSQSDETESQPVRGPAEGGLEGVANAAGRLAEAGGGGESSSQSADVEVRPDEGEQEVLPAELR